MKRSSRAALTFGAVLALWAAGCGGANSAPRTPGSASAPAETPAATPPELAAGERLFDANCALCHGPRGSGTDQGPPLVHIIYEPNHHADVAFQMAAMQGVRAHHWRFGDMPPVPGVNAEDVEKVTAYIRWLQREAGIGE
jgi:mono/diheme cytochrome c family protein